MTTLYIATELQDATGKASGSPQAGPIAAPTSIRLRDRLAARISAAPPNAPKPKPERPISAVSAAKVEFVAPTGAGHSKLQPGSRRGTVMAFIAAQKRDTVSVAEVAAHFRFAVRSYIGKLIYDGHIAPVPKAAARTEFKSETFPSP